MHPPRTLRAFRRQDYDQIRQWFDDPVLARTLGPLDEEWLETVMAEDPPAEFVFVENEDPIARIGIARPTQTDQPIVVTDLAVRPDRRHEGIGRDALAALLRDEVPPSRECSAYVLLDNPGAKAFFEAIGWHSSPPVDGMIPFVAPR